MNHTRFWVASAILAIVIIIGFMVSVPHTTKEIQQPALLTETAPAPQVTLQESYKKGTRTFKGTVLAPNACATAEAAATLAGDASTTERISVDVTLRVDTENVCLQLPTEVSFSTSLSAGPDLPLSVTVNGIIASTTTP